MRLNATLNNANRFMSLQNNFPKDNFGNLKAKYSPVRSVSGVVNQEHSFPRHTGAKMVSKKDLPGHNSVR